MAIPSGLGSQYGFKKEATWGTGVTVDRFLEFNSEGLKKDQARTESSGLRAGTRVLRSDRWKPGSKTVGGPITHELMDRGQALLWELCLGSIATAQPDAAGNPTVYKHTATPGDLVSATLQVGRPDVNGVAQPFTYTGAMVASWELACAVDAVATLSPTWAAKDEDTATALATAAYPAAQSLLTFTEGSLTIAGSPVNVASANLSGDNGLKTDRRFLGSTTIFKPKEAALRNFTGQLEAEFTGLTDYNRFVNGTEAALVLLFEGATISSTYKYQVKVTANVRFDGETPNVGGPDEIRQPLPFKCLGNTGATAITVDIQTTDTTP